MGLMPVELLMARRQIRELIRRDVVYVSFRRQTKVDVPGGGWRYGPSTQLRPQAVTITSLKRRLTDNTVSTEMGNVVDGDYVITGEYDLDIQKDDEFTYNGGQYKVTQIEPDNEVQTIAIVEYTGGDPNG